MYIIFSQNIQGTLKLEGQGYSTKTETKRYIKLFRSRVEANNEVQKRFGIDSLNEIPEYLVVEKDKIIN